ncbi:hypothetical protein GCM10011529_20130 [Polymorphobacter glacialis]|uniref:Uncharacterized protein n=1 Tax=Sandarakinorhabdus glacialis TaxID=1614636 RepID=A0A916ZUD8_9SPHN|nr:hypothetical protein [Polymorphobacter glacialis]GGE13719.1 hypothetical protein GCM10011529_20130 [Polymorphobacter glacialis]
MLLLRQTFGKQDDGTAAEASRCEGLLRQSAAHRIRLGLTGLAAIFLVVMIAAAGLRPTASVAATGPQAEPLAVLGVAPGAPASMAVSSSQPRPAELPRQRARI